MKKSLSSKWNGVIWIAEDAAMIDASMDIVSSREVRQKVRRKKSVKHLVGGLIDAYFKDHLIGAKVRILFFIAVDDRSERLGCFMNPRSKEYDKKESKSRILFNDAIIYTEMSGASEWTENELHLPSIPSGPGRRIGPAVRDTL